GRFFLHIEAIQVAIVGRSVILEVAYNDTFQADVLAYQGAAVAAALNLVDEGHRVATLLAAIAAAVILFAGGVLATAKGSHLPALFTEEGMAGHELTIGANGGRAVVVFGAGGRVLLQDKGHQVHHLIPGGHI